MAYEPKTEEGKEALKAGADPAVVEEMESEGISVKGGEEDTSDEGKHVDKEPEDEEEPDEKDQVIDPVDPAQPGKDKEPKDEEEVTPDRTPKHIPVWKAKEEAKKAAEEAAANAKAEAEAGFQQQLAEMGRKPGGATDDEVTKLAEDLSLSPEATKALIDKATELVSKRLGVDDIRKDIETRKAAEKEVAEDKGFRDEMGSADTIRAIREATGGRDLSPEEAAKVKEFAYSTTYSRYRVKDIIHLEKANIITAKPAPSPSAEQGRGGTGRGGNVAPKSLDEVTPGQIDDMTDEEFAQFSDGLSKGNSRFSKITSPKR